MQTLGFWFPAVPEIEKIKNENNSLLLLINYLKSPKITGYDCVATAYFICKVAPILRENFIIIPWLNKSTINYQMNLIPFYKRNENNY